MDPRAELVKILDEIGPENIWRDIFDPDGVMLAKGIENGLDCRPEELAKVDFTGKTVLDIGCNFGHFSFQIKKRGASRVIGLDRHDMAIRGAELIKQLFPIENVDFVIGDFTRFHPSEPFDICLFVNFLGKTKVRAGIVHYLRAVESLTRKTIVMTAREFYKIPKHLGDDYAGLEEKYSSIYIRKKRFYLGEYLQDYFSSQWNVSIISPRFTEDDGVKWTYLIEKK